MDWRIPFDNVNLFLLIVSRNSRNVRSFGISCKIHLELLYKSHMKIPQFLYLYDYKEAVKLSYSRWLFVEFSSRKILLLYTNTDSISVTLFSLFPANLWLFSVNTCINNTVIIGKPQIADSLFSVYRITFIYGWYRTVWLDKCWRKCFCHHYTYQGHLYSDVILFTVIWWFLELFEFEVAIAKRIDFIVSSWHYQLFAKMTSPEWSSSNVSLYSTIIVF